MTLDYYNYPEVIQTIFYTSLCEWQRWEKYSQKFINISKYFIENQGNADPWQFTNNITDVSST